MIISYADLKNARRIETTNETLANEADKAHNKILFYVSGTRKNSTSWDVMISANRAKTPEKITFAQTVVLSDLKLVSRLNQIAKLAGGIEIDIDDRNKMKIDGKK